MNLKTCSSISTDLHCQHRFPSNRFCRLPISDPASRLCFKHALSRQKDRDLVDLAATLVGQPDDFHTAAGINHSLGELYKLLAQDRISPRRAAVLAYISNLLLRTLPAIEDENSYESNYESAEDISPAVLSGAPRPISN